MQLFTFLTHRNLLISKYIKLWVFFLTDIYLIYNIVCLRILNKELWTCPCPLRTLRFSFSLTLSLSKFVFISVISWDYVSKLGRTTGRSASTHYQMHQPLVLGWRFGFLFLQHMRGCLSHKVCSWGIRVSCFHQLYAPALTFTVGPQRESRCQPLRHTLFQALCPRHVSHSLGEGYRGQHQVLLGASHTHYSQELYCSFCRGRSRKAELFTQSYMVSQDGVEPGSEFHSSSRQNLQSFSQTPRGHL